MEKDVKTNRSRTVTWKNPKTSSRDADAISGLDYLRSIKEGVVQPPPIARLVGYHIIRVSPGKTVFGLNPDEYHYNPFETVHGGILSTLLDTAMTSAVLSKLPIGKACATLEMKINYIRPVKADTGLIHARAEVVHLGAHIATAQGKILDAHEKLYAHGVSTCSVFKSSSA